MVVVSKKSVAASIGAMLVVLVLSLVSPVVLLAKKKNAPPEPAPPPPDYSKIQIPPLPNIARLKYEKTFFGVKLDTRPEKERPKSWMDRMAGVQDTDRRGQRRLPFQLLSPMDVAVDSKGMVYVPDQKVGAVFIFNPETGEVQFIRHGTDARFSLINGVAIDDLDRLFVSDGRLKHVLVFNAEHKLVDQINEGMDDPIGLAVDNENRFLYVADYGLDQVLVYNLDSFKLLRKIGTTGHKHELTDPGNFGGPYGLAVDKDGNLYVTDVLNNRVEVFDAAGTFVRTFGQIGDAVGQFGRPKGITIDSDGHVWVADQFSDRITIFDPSGFAIIAFGGHGRLPSQFKALVGVCADRKRNRIYMVDQYPSGRLQMFRYVTEAEAQAEFDRRQEERARKAQEHGSAQPGSPQAPPAAPAGTASAPAK